MLTPYIIYKRLLYIREKTPKKKKRQKGHFDVIKRKSNRYYNKRIQNNNNSLIATTPMKYIFTPEELRPSKRTIQIIKQIAYTYRAFKMNGKYEVLCLN